MAKKTVVVAKKGKAPFVPFWAKKADAKPSAKAAVKSTKGKMKKGC